MSNTITIDAADPTDAKDYLVWRTGTGRTVEIEDIAVHSERRKGKGRQLMARLLQEVGSNHPSTAMIYAITRAGNTIAHQFYEAMGFRLVGRLHYFYRDVDENGKGSLEHALVYGLDT